MNNEHWKTAAYRGATATFFPSGANYETYFNYLKKATSANPERPISSTSNLTLTIMQMAIAIERLEFRNAKLEAQVAELRSDGTPS